MQSFQRFNAKALTNCGFEPQPPFFFPATAALFHRSGVSCAACGLFRKKISPRLLHFVSLSCMIFLLPKNSADVAQSVEHILGKDEVTSSNLVISSTSNPLKRNALRGFCYAHFAMKQNGLPSFGLPLSTNQSILLALYGRGACLSSAFERSCISQ